VGAATGVEFLEVMISPSPSESFDNVSTFYVNVKPLSCIQESGSLCAGNLMSNIIVIIGNVSVIQRLHTSFLH
jgi:hypothetical protein